MGPMSAKISNRPSVMSHVFLRRAPIGNSVSMDTRRSRRALVSRFQECAVQSGLQVLVKLRGWNGRSCRQHPNHYRHSGRQFIQNRNNLGPQASPRAVPDYGIAYRLRNHKTCSWGGVKLTHQRQVDNDGPSCASNRRAKDCLKFLGMVDPPMPRQH